VDPPISDSYFSSGRNDKEGTKTNLSLRPFRGFCEDFLDAPKFSSDWMSLADTPRGGMASEVVLYWERNIPSCFNAQNPTLESLAYYPFNIVAAEWVKYVAVMHNCIKMYEYHGDQLPSLDQFNTDLRELQVWRRRSMVSQQKLRSIIGQLKARHCHKTTQNMSDISLLVEDFEVICTKIEDAGRRLENMLPVVTSLVQIIDARRSFAETTNISRLTILALTFVPLSFVSSLFSMNDYNAPGARGFWVYFAVAIPITLLVFLVARPPTKLIKRCLEWFKAPMKRPLAVRRLSRDVAKGKVTEA
jgi:Mg2+ and Co2+ transporter CorA